MKANELLDNILVINMDKHHDRLLHMKKELDKYNLKFKKIKGIDGSKLNIPASILNKFKVESASTNKKIEGNYVPGAIGCALSHLSAYKYCVRNNLPYICIFEDDITITPDILKFKDMDIPDDMDILFLGNCPNKWPRNCCNPNPDPFFKKIDKINKNVLKYNYSKESPIGTYAIIYSNRASRYILDNYKLENAIDIFINNETLNKLNVYGIIPSPVIHCYKFNSNTYNYKNGFNTNMTSNGILNIYKNIKYRNLYFIFIPLSILGILLYNKYRVLSIILFIITFILVTIGILP